MSQNTQGNQMLLANDRYLGKAEVLGSSPSRGTIVFPCNSRNLDKSERLNGPPAFVVLSVNE